MHLRKIRSFLFCENLEIKKIAKNPANLCQVAIFYSDSGFTREFSADFLFSRAKILVLMSNFLNSGIKRASNPTVTTQIIPPLVTEIDNVVTAAIDAARIWPANGPSEYDNNSIPARRPRKLSGMVWFHIADLKSALTMSDAPANVRNKSTSHK